MQNLTTTKGNEEIKSKHNSYRLFLKSSPITQPIPSHPQILLNSNKEPALSLCQIMLSKDVQTPYYLKTTPMDATLLFESRFESGNLNYAVKISDTFYLLVLQYDTSAIGHTQWYYFRVSNTKKDTEVKFSIINMVKNK